MASIQGPDFTKSSKDVLLVRLPDGIGGGFDLAIKPPTKGAFDRLVALAGTIDGITGGKVDAEDFDMDEALSAVAEIMSHNTAYKKIDAETLNLCGFDIEDIGTFVGAYILFISQLVEAKN